MPIIAIIQQPTDGSINAAYRPVQLTVRATASNGDPRPPVVYCDIYFGNVYYKTLSKSQFTKLNANDTDWTFDIQDACQESLRVTLGVNGGHVMQYASAGVASVQCRFRSSGHDANGFTVPDGTAPVQATGGTPAVGGTGVQSTSFYVLNVTLQHEDNQDLATHLYSYKTGSWHHLAFPLTHRPRNYKICRSDSDYYPYMDAGMPFPVNKLRLNYRLIGQSTWRQATSNLGLYVGDAMYMPNGPKNLAPLFAVNFNNIEEYYVEGLSGAGAGVATVTTTHNHISNCCEDDKIRIHFSNYLGTIDAINFHLVTMEHQPTSSSWERSLKAPLDKAVHGLVRSNIKSNNTYNVVATDYNEAQMDWIEELFDSGLAWMEWKGTQGQADNYIPITITDKSFQTRKEDDRYIYELAVEFRLSHEKILIRT